MTALWLRLRAELRHRWGGVLALGLVAGLAGAAVLTAAAGAHRTDTAYERMLAATRAPNFVVRTGTGIDTPFTTRDVERLPGVQTAAPVSRFYLTTQGPRATVAERAAV